MELVLALHEKTHLRVTCDDHYSHLADLHPLLFQNEEAINITFEADPRAYGKQLYSCLIPFQ